VEEKICYKCGKPIDITKSYGKIPVDPTKCVYNELGELTNEADLEWKYKHSPRCPK